MTATFRFGDGREVRRLGFGAMRIVGPGIWGPPADLDSAVAVLRRAVELGVDFVDTADAYGPDISEQLVRTALHPYGDVFVASKAGLLRPGVFIGDTPALCGRPEYLHQQLHKSLRNLGVDQLDLWYLHRIDPTVPADDQFGALRDAVDNGLVARVGLSAVSVAEIEHARTIVEISAVQNRYSVGSSAGTDVLAYCAEHGIAFVPFFPIGGMTGLASTALADVADRYGATPRQVALAWLLHRSPVMLPIPGTGHVGHLEHNLDSRGLHLAADDVAALDAVGVEA